ncbi:MAG: transposase [Chloroflexi bacterium]|nr:MAG: transposase [Chloroflexota bacterium]
MRKAFKYRIYPNKEQERKLFWTLTRCRELYNAALSERRDAYTYERKSITYRMQQNDLPEIRDLLREEYQQIHSQVLQDVLKRLEKAFQHFFRRVMNGEKPGYPRFQGRNRYNSFTYPQGGYTLSEKSVTLGKIGTIKCVVHRPMEGQAKTCTTKYESGQWYVVFSCDVKEPERLPGVESEVGIDLGGTHFAALSDGTFIENPRHFRKAEKLLQRRSQVLSRKKQRSHRREKARRLVTKAHRKILNQRRDFHHQQSRQLVDTRSLIVFEDLQIANLTKAPKPKQDEATGHYLPNGAVAKGGLNKSILDAGWAIFQQMCTYKAAWAGRTVMLVDPKFTSQVCSGCGTFRKKDLSERWHSCSCGVSLDRDTNAAVNILYRGKKQLLGVEDANRAKPVEAPCL